MSYEDAADLLAETFAAALIAVRDGRAPATGTRAGGTRPRNKAFRGAYVVLERPACAGKRRVRYFYSSSMANTPIFVSPSLGDVGNPRWCPGTYRGTIRFQGARTPAGTFTFRIR